MKKFCYKPLWKLLIDREITKTELLSMAQISQSSMQKLRTNKNVTTDVLLRIINALSCELTDIVCCVEEEQ